MERRLRLRISPSDAGPAAGVEALRAALGGRQPDGGGTEHGSLVTEGALATEPGSLVTVEGRPGGPVAVLFTEGDDAHLWVGDGRVRRVNRAWVRPFEGAAPPDVAAIARELRAFASLREGERVCFLTGRPADGDGRVETGELVEKCRHGALIARSDGVVLAVGFRRLWRASPA
jgi:hypothetical protein